MYRNELNENKMTSTTRLDLEELNSLVVAENDFTQK